MSIQVIKDQEVLEKMSKHFGKDIDEVQVWGKEVLFFWPHFWWFKHRSRISIEKYNKIIEGK